MSNITKHNLLIFRNLINMYSKDLSTIMLDSAKQMFEMNKIITFNYQCIKIDDFILFINLNLNVFY